MFSKNNIYYLKKKFKCSIGDFSQEKFDRIAHNYEIILLRFTLNLKFKKNSKIKYIISPTTGLNHIDKKILNSRKIRIFYLNNKNFLKKVNATVEHTIYLILNLIKRRNIKIKFGFKKNYTNYISNELHNKTVGIVGYGRIGKKVAKICKAFGAKVIFHDKSKKNKTLKELFKLSDIITFHVPLNSETQNFYDLNKLKNIKKNAILINTSRGEIFNEKDLLTITKRKKLKLGLDVISNENSLNNSKNAFFKYIKNNLDCFITPHVAGLTKESIELTDNHVISKFFKNLK